MTLEDNADNGQISVEDTLDALLSQPRIPRATYRLQFNADFTFEDAQALVLYLDDLGISELYASPLFKPRPGSTHGYDTVDYGQFNPALGTAEAFDALAAALAEREMGILLDIVPNHMGVSTENAWWFDVLKHGPSSKYAHYFDIDWRPKNRTLDDKVLLPVLGDHFGRVLEAGELEVVYWHGDFYVHYYEHQFPMTPESYGRILGQVLHMLPDDLDESEAWVHLELASVVRSLDYLPSYTNTNPGMNETRRREETIIRWRLLGLFDKSEVFRDAMQQALQLINGTQDEPESFDLLEALLTAQPYRLAYWRVATDEINYRRFFDINDMAALRIEDPQVFADVHRLAFRLLAEGKVQGLRIDHPDGLWDPEGYFWRLQTGYLAAALNLHLADGADYSAQIHERLRTLYRDSDGPTPWPLFVLVEKILSESEPLPLKWAVYGTTGYDFMYVTNNLFVDATTESQFETIYSEFINESIDLEELTDYTKKLVMSQSLTSELDGRSTELAAIVEQTRRYRGFTQNSLAFGLSEFVAALDIYRTYISTPETVSNRDRTYIEVAIEQAKQRNPLVPSSIFDFLRNTLLMQNFDTFADDQYHALREFVMKFQQITGPVMAKSMEDTTFYIYNRLASLNEVGGHLNRFGASVEEFHSHNRNTSFPHAMLSTSTHDTKRSEDVRARINVLSEMPERWHQALNQWAAMNADAKTDIGDLLAPAPNDEYLIYQTLLGTYQPGVDEDDTYLKRMVRYMHKAINEAKTHSNWVNPNTDYAQAVADFITQIWSNPAFRDVFDPLLEQVQTFGWYNSLAQVLLKLTSPGVPDIYQGNELWDYSLVDPDNRRAVDFEHRQALLADIQTQEGTERLRLAENLLQDIGSGAIKLYLTYRTLHFRRQNEALFRAGNYVPVTASGTYANHVCAFMRTHGDSAALIIVPRLVATMLDSRPGVPLGSDWGDTALRWPAPFEGQPLENILTGETFNAGTSSSLSHILTTWPLALLTTQKSSS